MTYMVKYGVPEKILQSEGQACWPSVNSPPPVKSYDQILKFAYFGHIFGQFCLQKSSNQYPMLHSVNFWDKHLIFGIWLPFIERHLDISDQVTKMNFAFCGTPIEDDLSLLRLIWVDLGWPKYTWDDLRWSKMTYILTTFWLNSDYTLIAFWLHSGYILTIWPPDWMN